MLENVSPAARARVVALVVALIATVLAMAAVAPATARAGTWTLVSCTLPSGAPAPTDGWSIGVYGGGYNAAGSGDTNSCATGGALTALSSSSAAPASYTGPEWTFTAPAGTTIGGGSVTASLTAPQGQAWLGTPGGTFDAADVLAACQFGSACGTGGTATGSFPITHPGGTAIYAPALCIAPGAATCAVGGGANGVNAEVAIHSAEIELDTDAVPAVSDLSGRLLSGRVSGTADVAFNASDPGALGGTGPGIYRATVAVDGAVVYAGTPDANAGACAPVGTDPADGALMFDTAQPCKSDVRVTVPVNTLKLSDGPHTLSVDVTDATGTTSAIKTQTFTSSNPIVTPAPTGADRVAASFTLGFGFTRSHTTLVTATARDLPPAGRIGVQCSGAGCPLLRPASVPVARIGKLWAMLEARRFRTGDRVYLTITAPRPEPRYRKVHGKRRRIAPGTHGTPPLTRPEHLRLTIRRGSRPAATLVGSVPAAR